MKKFSIILSSLILSILLIGMISAMEFDNVKSYDQNNKEITITNLFGFGGDLQTIELKDNTDNGRNFNSSCTWIPNTDTYECYSILKMTFYEDLQLPYQKESSTWDMNFYKTDKSTITNAVEGYRYQILTGTANEPYSYQDNSNHTYWANKSVDVWADWNPEGKTFIKNQEVYIKVIGVVKKDNIVEWIPTYQGVKIEEFGIWDASSLFFGYAFDENVIPTTVYDYTGLYNSTTQIDTDEYKRGYQTWNASSYGLNSSNLSTQSQGFNNTYVWVGAGYSTSAYSISFWVNSTEYYPGLYYENVLFSTGVWLSAGGGFGRQITVEGNNLSLIDPNSDANSMRPFCKYKNDGLWHHCVITHNSTGAYGYTDGYLTNRSSGNANDGATPKPQPYFLRCRVGDTACKGGFSGTIDDFRYYSYTLNETEILQLNATAQQIFPTMDVIISYPANNSKFIINNIGIGCNFTSTLQNITSVKVNVTQISTSTQVYSDIETGLNTENYNKTWTTSALSEGDYRFTCSGYGSQGYNSTSNYNYFGIDVTAPNVTIIYPSGAIQNNPSNNFSLNYSIVDSHIDSCWYNYNYTNFSVLCNANSTFIYNGQKNLTLYANDTYGNTNITYTSWDYSFIENNRTFNNPVISGTFQQFNLSVYLTTYPSYPYLVYNNTSHLGTITSLGGNNYLISNSLNVPTITTQTNFTFYWSITDSNNNITNTSSSTQNVNILQIDNCTLYNNLLFNFTLRDEDTQVIIDGLAQNSSINLNINVYDSISNSLLGTVNQSYYRNSNPKFCIGNSLINSSTYITGLVEYQADNYVHEFYYLSNFQIVGTYFNINLFDLLISRSQEFLITYKNSNFLPAEGILVYVTRNYINENTFKTVEVAKTDNNGQALVHLVLADVIYTFIFVDSNTNQVLSTLSNYVPFCENIATGQCTINSNAFQTSSNIDDYSTLGGITFNQNFNQTNRSITLTFTSLNGSSIVNSTIILYNNFGNNTICSNQLNSPSGTIICNIPMTYGNASFLASVYSNGLLISEETYSIIQDPTSIYGVEGVLFAILIIITLSMIFITSPIGIIIGAMVGLIISGVLGLLVTGSVFGKGSIIIWAIISAGFLIWKINKGESQ